MFYKNYDIKIPSEKREDFNNKILHVIKNKTKELSKEEIYNCYTGIGGLSGLDFSEFNNYSDFSKEKKRIEIGQFFTPHNICSDIVSLINPSKTDRIADLTCGTGNFFNFLPVKENLYGCDIDKNAVTVAKHLYPDSNIINKNISHYYPNIKFDLIFGNPPFNLIIDEILSQFYFIKKSADLLLPGGILVLITPKSFLSDEFFNKTYIEEINHKFNFIIQFELPKNSFSSLGVKNFSTKVLIFQRHSNSLTKKFYDPNKFAIYDINKIKNLYILPLQKEKESLKASFFLELSSNKKTDSFDYKISKLLYHIKTNPNTLKFYNTCLDYIKEYKNQKRPEFCSLKEWEETKITSKKVYSYLKRILKKQILIKEKDVIRLVKSKNNLKFKAYSKNTKKIIKSLDIPLSYDINDLIIKTSSISTNITDVIYNKSLLKLVNKKKKQYEYQNKKFSEIIPSENINKFLKDFRFLNGNNDLSSFNQIQLTDISKCLSKKYSILNWHMGTGKTAATYAWSKFLLKKNSVKKIFIVSTALAINSTWEKFLTKHNQKFVKIQSFNDLSRVGDSDFILLPLSRINNTRKKTSSTYYYEKKHKFLKNLIKKYETIKNNNNSNLNFYETLKIKLSNLEENENINFKLYKYIRKIVKFYSYKCGLIFDESDEITNHLSNKSRSVLSIFRKLKYKLLATGTTTRNNINELFSQLELLYNNSINFLCECETIYKEIKNKETGSFTISKKHNDKFYLKPFHPYFGNQLFKACFNPSKTTVFGIKKHNQDIYNIDQLKSLIEKTIITRTFKDIAGPDKYEIIPHKINQNINEIRVYHKIISSLQEMLKEYFGESKNKRKDAMLRILRQLQLLIKATSIPHTFKEFFPENSDNSSIKDNTNDFSNLPLFSNLYKPTPKKFTKDNYPEKFIYIKNLLEKYINEKIAIGCTTIEAVKLYNELSDVFKNRQFFTIKGSVSFFRRNKIIEEFEKTSNGILICTQQSLKSSVNIPTCNNVIIETLQWNIPKLEQFYFRFIRFDSKEKTFVNLINYDNTIEMNLLALLMAKERINEFIKTLNFKAQSEIYNEFGIDLDILNSILEKEYDPNTETLKIKWGRQNIS